MTELFTSERRDTRLVDVNQRQSIKKSHKAFIQIFLSSELEIQRFQQFEGRIEMLAGTDPNRCRWTRSQDLKQVIQVRNSLFAV